jgi:hypothetical protein
MVEHAVLRAGPLLKPSDASQRTFAPASRVGAGAACGDASQRSPACHGRFGESVAGGDASQRNSVGRVSLGVASVKGDASQRSPPGCTNRSDEYFFAHLSPISTAAQQDYAARAKRDPTLQPNTHPQVITGTCPLPDVSSQGSSRGDASQRSLGAGAPGNSTVAVPGSSDALKSWLSGASGSIAPVDDSVLAEQLLAAVPESYDD